MFTSTQLSSDAASRRPARHRRAVGAGGLAIMLGLAGCSAATPTSTGTGTGTGTPTTQSTAAPSSSASAAGTGIPSMSLAGTTCVPVTIVSSDPSAGGSGGTDGSGQGGTPPTGAPGDTGGTPPAAPPDGSGQGGTPPTGAPGDAGGTPPAAPPDGSGQGGTPPTGAPGDAGGTPPAAPPDGAGQAGSGNSGSGGAGAPPTGDASQGGGQAPGGSSSDYTITGATTIKDETKTSEGESFDATKSDQSAILVESGGVFSLTNPTVTKSGDTSSNDASSFYGLNASVLATNGGAVGITDGTLSSTSTGSNPLFAYGSGSVACMSGGTIKASAQGGHAIMASGGGTIVTENVVMSSEGANGATIATDRGSGTVIVKGGTATTSGADSPVLYSTGNLTVSDLKGVAKISEGLVIEGDNSITLNDSTIEGASVGIMLYQSMSGDAEVGTATFTMSGGSLTTDGSATGHYSGRKGDAIYVGNTNATITLKDGAKVESANDVLLYVEKKSDAKLTADGVTLVGNVEVASDSAATLTLKNGTSLTSTVKGAGLALDGDSTWTVTGDSTLTTLTGAVISGDSITNITGGGHTVTYDASDSSNSELAGKTYQLAGGGELKPVS